MPMRSVEYASYSQASLVTPRWKFSVDRDPTVSRVPLVPCFRNYPRNCRASSRKESHDRIEFLERVRMHAAREGSEGNAGIIDPLALGVTASCLLNQSNKDKQGGHSRALDARLVCCPIAPRLDGFDSANRLDCS